MTEADRVFSEHGEASVGVLKRQIENAFAKGDEAEALRLDAVLQEVERLVNDEKKTTAQKMVR